MGESLGLRGVYNDDLNLTYLQARLARLDVLIQHAIRCWQRAGQDHNDPFRGLYVTDEQITALLDRPLATNWGLTGALPPDELSTFARLKDQAQQAIRSFETQAQHAGIPLRLAQLEQTFALDQFEIDALLICLAPALDLRYQKVYGYLQDDITQRHPRVNLILDLLCKPGRERLQAITHFGPQAPLFRYHLLERTQEVGTPLLGQALHVDPTIVAWLLDSYQPHRDLEQHATLLQPADAPKDELLAAEVQSELDRLLAAAQQTRPAEKPIAIFCGPDLAGQRAAARQLCARLARTLLQVDLAAAGQSESPPDHIIQLALRDARLTGAIPFFSGWETHSAPRQGVTRSKILAEICAYPDLVIIAGRENWQAGGFDRQRRLFWLAFPIPAYPQRAALWRHFLAQADLAADLDLAPIAGQFLLTTSQIRDSVASARDRASQHNKPIQGADLLTAARMHSNPRLANLARKITPRFDWQDIVLPDDQLTLLHEIIDTVRGRPLVFDTWNVSKKLASSTGVTVLFSGPPGTGKTMAAEIIAAELGLDLYKIDLSTIVSKYIGETEKNLEKIFGEAQSSNAILFFDEADAIFGKRSEVKDAHDRYANIEISYLLQRMEDYDGVTILATNLRANLDDAFTRRLQFAVDFPFPEQHDRLRIWHALLPAGVPCADDLDLALLAQRFRLAGGNIRNILVSASFLAAADGGQLTMAHLLHGTRRELQKMGRLIGEDDLAIS